MQTVLTIAGFDPSSGAGVTADLMVFAAHGLFGTSAITALTVQSSCGVAATHPVGADVLLATLRFLTADLPPAGIKIGMLATASSVESVITFLTDFRAEHPHAPIVLDPVLRSTSGKELLDAPGIDLLRTSLLPLVNWVTPNLAELALLTDLPVQSRADMLFAAGVLQSEMSLPQSISGDSLPNIIVTGGHLDPPDDLLAAFGSNPVWLPGRWIPSNATHGTGCTFSSALLARLVLGDPAQVAALAAKSYVAEAIRSATDLPQGGGPGPLNHLWPLRPC